MGYDVHITRSAHWADNEKAQITPQEWLSLIERDPELIQDPQNGPHFVIYRGTNRYPETWFDWSDGNIDTTAPDRATLQKMLQIATQLGARVQGDDGEIYDEAVINTFDDSFLESGTGRVPREGLLHSLLRLLRRR